ncbi:MAG: monovalent cation/H+ antiporter complex subunit F [Chthoniobacterales bacterium]
MLTPTVSIIVFLLLSGALLFTLIRLLIGPTLSDRVVALDLLGFVIVSIIAANMLQTGETFYLDVLVVFGILIFFGTVAFARYIEKRLQDDD